MFSDVFHKAKKETKQIYTFSYRLLRMFMMFALITVTWIFFAADQMKFALQIIKQLFGVFN